MTNKDSNLRMPILSHPVTLLFASVPSSGCEPGLTVDICQMPACCTRFLRLTANMGKTARKITREPYMALVSPAVSQVQRTPGLVASSQHYLAFGRPVGGAWWHGMHVPLLFSKPRLLSPPSAQVFWEWRHQSAKAALACVRPPLITLALIRFVHLPIWPRRSLQLGSMMQPHRLAEHASAAWLMDVNVVEKLRSQCRTGYGYKYTAAPSRSRETTSA